MSLSNCTNEGYLKTNTQNGMMKIIDISPSDIDNKKDHHRQQNCIDLTMTNRKEQDNLVNEISQGKIHLHVLI